MKRILSFILSINLIFILVPGTVLAAPSWPSAVSIEADGGILMEAQTGTVLFAKNEDQPYYPASITKILTALIVLEHCSLDEEVTFSHDVSTVTVHIQRVRDKINTENERYIETIWGVGYRFNI